MYNLVLGFRRLVLLVFSKLIVSCNAAGTSTLGRSGMKEGTTASISGKHVEMVSNHFRTMVAIVLAAAF